MKKISTRRGAAPKKPLTGRVALVAGATRGAGRGIARALADAGATVYCTGRSVKGKPSPYGRPETIDETAKMIQAAGGKAIAVRVDHTNEPEVKALLDPLVDFGVNNHTSGSVLGGSGFYRNTRGQVTFANSPSDTEGFIFQLEP